MRGRILATLDHASEGRAALRIAAGWFEEEFAASRDRFPEAAERISKLAGATESIRTTWTGSPATITAAWRVRPRR
jgi:alkanesulfonate monooxygenase SsuD/methylene tetrahydromethanopterin reductase-like flavin-dependent oxidoreductase (luciferase family)